MATAHQPPMKNCVIMCLTHLGRDDQHFLYNIFKCIFWNENAWILIKISLKFVPKDPINNIPALVQRMAWHQSGDKTLSEPMRVSLLMHICMSWPQWINEILYWVWLHSWCWPNWHVQIYLVFQNEMILESIFLFIFYTVDRRVAR